MDVTESDKIEYDGRSLRGLLDLTPSGEGRFIGRQPEEERQRIFGGQVVAQAVMAAAATVDTRRELNSLHCHFVAIGVPTVPIHYEVDVVRDGRSFAFRRVAALQEHKTLLILSASFHAPEMGDFAHQERGPFGLLNRLVGRAPVSPVKSAPQSISSVVDHPVDVRPSRSGFVLPGQPRSRRTWCRAEEQLGDTPFLHSAAVSYMSDLLMMNAIISCFDFSPWQDTGLSLDHSMWFHRPVRADEWLLFDCRSPIARGGRGISMGRIYDPTGDLAVSVVQEGLLRRRRA